MVIDLRGDTNKASKNIVDVISLMKLYEPNSPTLVGFIAEQQMIKSKVM